VPASILRGVGLLRELWDVQVRVCLRRGLVLVMHEIRITNTAASSASASYWAGREAIIWVNWDDWHLPAVHIAHVHIHATSASASAATTCNWLMNFAHSNFLRPVLGAAGTIKDPLIFVLGRSHNSEGFFLLSLFNLGHASLYVSNKIRCQMLPAVWAVGGLRLLRHRSRLLFELLDLFLSLASLVVIHLFAESTGFLEDLSLGLVDLFDKLLVHDIFLLLIFDLLLWFLHLVEGSLECFNVGMLAEQGLQAKFKDAFFDPCDTLSFGDGLVSDLLEESIKTVSETASFKGLRLRARLNCLYGLDRYLRLGLLEQCSLRYHVLEILYGLHLLKILHLNHVLHKRVREQRVGQRVSKV